MLKRLFPALLACAMVFAVALPAKPQTAPTVFAGGTLSGLGQTLTLDLGGQTTCRASLVPTGGFVGTLTAGIEAVGDSSFQGMALYDDNGLPVTTVTSAGGYYTLYPKSAGTIEIAIATWSNGGMNVTVNCSPAGGPPPKRDALGNESVTFPSAQPVTLPGVTFPTPIPTLPSVIPTATPIAAGTASPVWAYLGIQCGTAGLWCPASGSGSNAAGSSRNALNIIPCNPIATLCAPPTPYPTPSAGAALGAAALPVTDPCFYTTGAVSLSSGNGFQRRCDVNGYTLATFPSAQPVNVQNTPGVNVQNTPGVTVQNTPGVNVMNTPTPLPLPTASAGVAPPVSAPVVGAFPACQYNGNDALVGGATPAPSIGNAMLCQANSDGSILTSNPQIETTVIATANGVAAVTLLDGQASCRLRMTASVGVTANVNVSDSSGVVFAGPYSATTTPNTATFQLVTATYVVGDLMKLNVNSFAGSGSVTMILTCTSAPGVEQVTFPSAQSVNIASPAPGMTPIPYQSFSGNVLKAAPTDTGGTAFTGASPMPVTMPTTAASPAPANLMASGFNAAGAAAPIICTQEVSGTISTAATVVVAAVSAKRIYVCSYSFSVVAGAASGNAAFSFGAPTTCLSPTSAGLAVDFLASSTFPATLTVGNGVGQVMAASNNNKALCIKASTAITAGNYDVMYEQF
jgi:hypothetical protein